MSEVKKLIKKIPIAFFFAVIFLCCLELFLRLLHPEYNLIAQPDPELGYVLIPNSVFGVNDRNGCPDTSNDGWINAYGLYDDDFDFLKPEDEYRVLVLGNSHIAAMHFPLEANVSSLLEQSLLSEGQVQVINGAHPSTKLSVHAHYLETKGIEFQPDLVVLFIFSSQYRFLTQGSYPTDEPHFYLDADHQLQLDYSFTDNADYRGRELLFPIRNQFYLTELILEMATLYKVQAPTPRSFPETMTISNRPINVRDEEAIETLNAILLRMHAVSQSNGARFLVVYAPNDRETNLNYQSQWDDWDQTQTLDNQARFLLADFTEQAQIHYLDLVPAFRDAVVTEQRYTHGCRENGGFGHWSRFAHRISAETVAPIIRVLMSTS